MRSPLQSIFVAAVMLLPTCNKPLTLQAERGELVVEWWGVRRGRFVAPASAIYCKKDNYLEVSAIRGDTGIGIALYPKDSLRAGRYAVFEPLSPSVPRPGAAGAIRWFGDMAEGTSIHAFQAHHGTIDLARFGNGSVSGTIEFQMRVPQGSDTLKVKGSFADLAIRPSQAACGRAKF